MLHIAEPMMLIAEAALILGHYPASAVTLQDSTLLRLRKEDMLDLMDRYPAYRRRVFATMSHWMERLVEKIDRLSLSDARSRLIAYLLDLHREQAGGEGEAVVRIPVKKGELSTLLNMNQATLSRALRWLQDRDLIEVQGRRCHLLDIQQLRSELLRPGD
jgi:CRP/FNR family transcriptional regulator